MYIIFYKHGYSIFLRHTGYISNLDLAQAWYRGRVHPAWQDRMVFVLTVGEFGFKKQVCEVKML